MTAVDTSTDLVIAVHDSHMRIDGTDIPEPHPDLEVQDSEVWVTRWMGTVHAGIGAIVHAHAGVTYTASDGAVVYHHHGAITGDIAPGLLEQAAITIVQVP